MQATPEAENEWTQHVYDAANKTLFPTTDSWFMNVNRNLPEQKRTFMLYTGGAPQYRDKCDESAATGYAGFVLA